jgi:hypothetical protein
MISRTIKGKEEGIEEEEGEEVGEEVGEQKKHARASIPNIYS